MGYNTNFKGELTFTKELVASQIACLTKILGEDCRDHPEWGDVGDLTYINLALTEDHTGLEWDCGEKTYEMHGLVNVVIDQMRKVMPEFGLEGELLAQGDEIGDSWKLVIVDGRAEQDFTVQNHLYGKCECHCDHKDDGKARVDPEFISVVKDLLAQAEESNSAYISLEVIAKARKFIAEAEKEDVDS